MSIQGLQFAQLAAAREIDRESEIRQAATLRAGLKDAASSPDRFRQRQALRDILHARFLAINVLSGIGGQRCGDRVPVRTGGYQHRVNTRSPPAGVMKCGDQEHDTQGRDGNPLEDAQRTRLEAETVLQP